MRDAGRAVLYHRLVGSTSRVREVTARVFAATICLAFCSCCVVAQDAFSAFLAGSGDVYTWFTPSTATADIDARVSLRGSFDIEGETVRFAADGTAVGDASIDLVSHGVTAWIVIDARGASEDGRTIRLHGGLIVTRIDGALTGSSGSGQGRFDFEVTLGQATFRAAGAAEGTASGQLVPTDIEFSMKATGVASAGLDGTIGPFGAGAARDCRTDVLVTASWPADLIDLLPALLVTEAADPIAP